MEQRERVIQSHRARSSPSPELRSRAPDPVSTRPIRFIRCLTEERIP